MIKFFKNHSKIFYIIGSFILVLMIAGMGLLIGSELFKKPKAAATWTVSVEKTAAITVYVSGKGVTPNKELSDDAYDRYLVEQGTAISLRAVNETRIFSEWVITGDFSKQNTVSLTDVRLDITPESNLTINLERVDAKVSDYGMYRNSYFNINVENHLYMLQLIFDAGDDWEKVKSEEVLNAYDTFFRNYSTYEVKILSLSNKTQAEEKAKKICDVDLETDEVPLNLFDKIQNGYYYVTSSFSLLNQNFTGIGSYATPFNGVICGNVGGVNSNIFVTMSSKETTGDIARGLFKVTGDQAVIRNLNIRTSVGIEDDPTAQASNIYVGGIAGYVNNSVISNVDVLARIAVDTTKANIYAGTVAGRFSGGLDSGRNVTLNGKNSTFILTTNASGASIYAGIITGEATDVYVKEANVDTTNFAISAKNTASNTYSDNTNVYLGNLFGKYTATQTMPIEEVNIHGTSKESITSLISSGNSYIGGLIGHLTVSAGTVQLGDVSITNTSGESKLSGSSVDAASQTNLLTAGLIACVVGDNLTAKPEFLDGKKVVEIDGEERYEYDYIFNTDLLIQSVNNGIDDNGTTYGKTMATGFIARGYMNLNGTSTVTSTETITVINEIFLSSGDYQTKVYATQTTTSSHANPSGGTNDPEHCLATAFYGNLNKTGYSMNYMNIYASNYDIAATRELGSTGKGDTYAAGFVAYSTDVDYTNITLYLNDSYIKGHSLSYEVNNTVTGCNNNYVGGFIGKFDGNSSSDMATLTNIKISGNYYHNTSTEVGTTTKIEGIQNTEGSTGNYTNENYVGGIVGRLYFSNINGAEFNGSTSNNDIISSLTHEDPASAFCGGIVGYIRNDSGYTCDVTNAKIYNTKVYGAATIEQGNFSSSFLPDIYIGGIVGSSYHDNSSSILNIENSVVINTDIIGEGNENAQMFSGGIIGSSTWDGTANISDCYVVGSNISSLSTVNIQTTIQDADDLYSFAAGIIARTKNRNLNISNSVVIDTTISSKYVDNTTYELSCSVVSAGILGGRDTLGGWRNPNVSINNCYSNAILLTTSSNTNSKLGICPNEDRCSVSNAYYVSQNAGGSSGKGTALNFSNKPISTNAFNSPQLLFDNLSQSQNKKLYIDIQNTNNFGSSLNNDDNVGVYYRVANTSSYADIWINAKSTGAETVPTSTSDLTMSNGWFNLGSLIVYNGNSSSDYTISDVEYKMYEDDTLLELDSDVYAVSITDSGIGSINKVTGTIGVTIFDNMPALNIKFKLGPNSGSVIKYYPALFDETGTLLSTNGLENDEYGTFEFTLNTTTYEYSITFYPNEDLESNKTFYIGLVDQSNAVYADAGFKLVLLHNEMQFIGLIYADYTKPINYQEITYTASNVNVIPQRYYLRPNSVTKILPVFKMAHGEQEIVISELNISKVLYSTDPGTIKSNGELIAPASGNGVITVTYNRKSIKINFTVTTEIGVTYTSIGSELEGLTYATPDSNYILDIDVLEHYGGDPSKFIISMIGGSENSFISEEFDSKFNQLILNLGGVNGEVNVSLYHENDGWSDPETITVTSNYGDHRININEGVTQFKIVNSNSNNIGLAAYSLVNTTAISTVEVDWSSGKDNGDNTHTFNDKNGSEMFTVSGAYQLDGETYYTANAGALISGFETFNDGRKTYYTSISIDFEGSADITLNGSGYRYEGFLWFYNWNEVDDIEINLSNKINEGLSNPTESSNNEIITGFTLTINNCSTDFKINSITIVSNESSKNKEYLPTELEGFSSVFTPDSLRVNGTAYFDFVDGISNPNFISDSALNITNDNNIYTVSGTNANISKITAKKTGLVLNYAFSSLSGASATFTLASGGKAVGAVSGCVASGSNLILNGGTKRTIYDASSLIKKEWIKVYENDEWVTATSWDIEQSQYRLVIPQDTLSGIKEPTGTADITIEIEFPTVYSITLDLKVDEFYPDFEGDRVYTYRVEAGTTFGELFGTPKVVTNTDGTTETIIEGTEVYNEFMNGVRNATKFGYVFGGFYLIDDGNSIEAYSSSLDQLIIQKQDLPINSSFMYYGRWSFLIEHIEAPGTDIQTSFEAGFLQDVGLTKEEQEEYHLSTSLTIPINNNRGYVFTVVKDPGFIGEAQVNAYIVDKKHVDTDKDGICEECGEDVTNGIREISIQKYHENMYLYYIPPEEITGYLVIVSNVTNSSIIVGKNTASVTEQILPEDGVYTFKYVVNHKYDESYIYDNDAGLLDLNREVLIEFYTQVYNEQTKSTDQAKRYLPAGTTVEVYYSLYQDNELKHQTIGVYETSNNNTSSIKLSEFKKWNESEDAFTTTTFRKLLSKSDNSFYDTTSEVYYFVVTPPNGNNKVYYDKTVDGVTTKVEADVNGVINDIIYVGYCNDSNDYISGSRNNDSLVNIPLEDIIDSVTSKESSKHTKIYSVTPSRNTTLTEDSDVFTFTDIKTYHVVDLNTSNLASDGDKLGLNTSSQIISSRIKGSIRELGLKLGYNKGEIKVSGKVNESDAWQEIATFSVDSTDYKYYYVDFESIANNFEYFKVECTSENEIRLEAFSYNTMNNAMSYEFNIADASVSGDVYSFINEIVGDTRHEGKTFMLEVELNSETIPANVITITVNGVVKTPLLSEREGKVKAYFNLSDIIKELNVDTITFTINNNSDSVIKSVKLLEATTAQKPAVSEERVVIPAE